MSKNPITLDLSPAECKELLQGCRHRRKALDKSFKQCMSEELKTAAEKVHESVKVVLGVEEKLKEALTP